MLSLSRPWRRRGGPDGAGGAALLTLTTIDGAARFAVHASDASGARLALLGDDAPRHAPEPGDRLVLVSADPALASVRFFVEVTHATAAPPELTICWVLLTATIRRRALVHALTRVLGLKAHVTADPDELGPHRKLIYEAASQQVRVINVGEATPPIDAASTPRPGAADAPPWRRTQPSILVETGVIRRPVRIAEESRKTGSPISCLPGFLSGPAVAAPSDLVARFLRARPAHGSYPVETDAGPDPT